MCTQRDWEIEAPVECHITKCFSFEDRVEEKGRGTSMIKLESAASILCVSTSILLTRLGMYMGKPNRKSNDQVFSVRRCCQSGKYNLEF